MRVRKELAARLNRLPPVAAEGQELWESVVAALRPAILIGDLPNGMRLIEEEIAARLGVSRGPVREALLVLEQEGLVTMEPRRGATVVGVTERDIRELYDLRRVLETHAARLAAQNARPEDIEHLRTLSERIAERVRSGRLDALAPSEIAFHRHLFVMANQFRLRAAWERVAGILGTLLTITGSTRPQSVRHDHIVKALAARDPEAATAAIQFHLERAEEIMIEVFRRAALAGNCSASSPPLAKGSPAGALDVGP